MRFITRRVYYVPALNMSAETHVVTREDSVVNIAAAARQEVHIPATYWSKKLIQNYRQYFLVQYGQKKHTETKVALFYEHKSLAEEWHAGLTTRMSTST